MMTIVAVVCLAAHFFTGWQAAMNDSAMHQQSAEFNQYVVEWFRDTFENLQSEFWQLAVQFALLAGLFEAIRVHAFEEDEEDLKQRLERIETLLQERAGHS
jgi:Tfp pilus assembly protein PilN